MSPDFIFCENMNTGKDVNPAEIPTLTYAFIGDGVYSLLVRELLSRKNIHPSTLHGESIKYVNASFQARAVDKIMPNLTDEEFAVCKRGRNVHTSHTPKNSTPAEYHKATSLEVLFGYLYITRSTDRIKELFSLIIKEVSVNE